jgi:glutamine synthetase
MSKLDEMISAFPETAQAYINGKKLDEVECIIADLPGIARGKAVPATKYSRQKSFHLPDSIFFSNNNWWLG